MLADFSGLCSADMCPMSSAQDMSPRFMLAVLLGSRFSKYAESVSVRSGMPKINRQELAEFEFASPSLGEQRAIAAALWDVDALLAKLDQLIAKKRDLKQAAMQQLLTGDIRLPGFIDECTFTTVGDVVEKIVGGGTPGRSNPAYWNGGIPWVTVKDFATFNPCGTQEWITKEGLSKSASHLIPAGTLITSTRMALGKVVTYNVDVSINQDLKALFTKSDVDKKFLFYWFRLNASLIADMGAGSTVMGISLATLRSLEVRLPRIKEQTAIAAILSDMDTELAGLETRRAKTRELKQGMMQALLTGRIRLT